MDGSEERRTKPPDLYCNDHEKWTVHVKNINTVGAEVGKIKFAKDVFQKLGNKCINLVKISKDTFRLDCLDKETANSLVKTQPFPNSKCFVPFNNKYCVGVLRDMDITMSEQEINELCGGIFSSVYRMMRFDKVKMARVPTNSVKVTMDCDELPEYLTVFGMRCKVYNFEQRVRVCYGCHRFGHFESNCKGETKKCGNCGQWCVGKCERATQCSSCNQNTHIFGDENCPVKKIESSIIQVMVNNKLSYFEAKDWIKTNVSADAFSCVLKNHHFPTIDESLKKKTKKMSKIERNNSISLEILKNVNEIKRQNNIITEKNKSIKRKNETGLTSSEEMNTEEEENLPNELKDKNNVNEKDRVKIKDKDKEQKNKKKKSNVK